MPASIIQKLIVMPVLEDLTKPVCERGTPMVPQEENSKDSSIDNGIENSLDNSLDNCIDDSIKSTINNITPTKKRPARVSFESSSDSSAESDFLESEEKPKKMQRKMWSDKEKKIIYGRFGDQILEGPCPSRKMISELFEEHKDVFVGRTVDTMTTFVHNKYHRKQKDVTPEVKRLQCNLMPKKKIPYQTSP